MSNEGNPLLDLNCEQLLSVVGDMMHEYLKVHDILGNLIYHEEKLQLVPRGDVPVKVHILFQIRVIDIREGFTRPRWNQLKNILAELQHEELCKREKSKLLPTKKAKNCCTS